MYLLVARARPARPFRESTLSPNTFEDRGRRDKPNSLLKALFHEFFIFFRISAYVLMCEIETSEQRFL